MATGSQNMTTYVAKNARNMLSLDTRSIAINPNSLTASNNGVQFDFKQKSITGLDAAYSGILSYRPYAGASDWSGGPAHQIAFDENGLHWHKSTGDTTWGGWEHLAFLSSNVASATKIASTPNNTTTFLRGDNTWSNQLANHIFNTTDIAEGAANLSTQATAHKMTFYRNGITIPYQMDNVDDGGMLRVRGTAESNCILELGTWDDSGAGETIQFNYYPTTSQVTPTYSVSVPKHSGTLVTTDGNGASGTWSISVSGSAVYASSYLANRGSVSGSSHAEALKAWFNSNKASEPRNALVAHYSSAAGNGSLCMGYFLSGYDDNPYGGFFVCHYDNPRYVGISNGTFTQHDLVTCDHAQNFTGNKTWGSSGAGGVLNGAATNGGLNSIRIGDDVWLGDCNAGGIMGMKSTGANTGFYFYNSSGTQTGQLYANGTGIYCNKTLQIHPTSGSYTEGIRIYPYGSWATIMLLSNDGTGTSGVTSNDWGIYNNNGTLYINKGTSSGAGNPRVYANANGWYFTKAYGAVWNDFAEYRKVDMHEPGYAIAPSGAHTSKRLESGARIASDTYGYAIGYMKDKEDLMPVAIAGRVLAYPLHDKSYYEVGDAVCAAEGGKIDKMTREEIMMYPDRILGIVNEIPDYDIWEPSLTGGGHEPVHTNGRIWIDIK